MPLMEEKGELLITMLSVHNRATSIDDRVREKVKAVDDGAQYIVHQLSKCITNDAPRWKMSTDIHIENFVPLYSASGGLCLKDGSVI